jgi:hypothetical protein
MKHDPRLKFCTCDDCSLMAAITHAVGDAKRGRKWECQCGHCVRARARADGGIDVEIAHRDNFRESRVKP